jgi:hypothetical protein
MSKKKKKAIQTPIAYTSICYHPSNELFHMKPCEQGIFEMPTPLSLHMRNASGIPTFPMPSSSTKAGLINIHQLKTISPWSL